MRITIFNSGHAANKTHIHYNSRVQLYSNYILMRKNRFSLFSLRHHRVHYIHRKWLNFHCWKNSSLSFPMCGRAADASMHVKRASKRRARNINITWCITTLKNFPHTHRTQLAMHSSGCRPLPFHSLASSLWTTARHQWNQRATAAPVLFSSPSLHTRTR